MELEVKGCVKVKAAEDVCVRNPRLNLCVCVSCVLATTECNLSMSFTGQEESINCRGLKNLQAMLLSCIVGHFTDKKNKSRYSTK